MADFLTYVAAVWFGFVGIGMAIVTVVSDESRPTGSMDLVVVLTALSGILYTGWSLFNLPG